MKTLDEFIKSIHNRTYGISYRKNIQVLISVYFIQQGQEKLILDHENSNKVKLLKQLVDKTPYDQIKVVIHGVSGDKNVFYDKEKIFTDEDVEKKQLLQNLHADNEPKIANSSNFSEPIMSVPQAFNGFGQAEIEGIISKRLAEEKTRMELIDLREKVSKKDQKISNLQQNIKELEGKLGEAANEQEKLETKIRLKENIRYYAGFAGDVLEGFGFEKSKLRQPLAGLLQEEESTTTEQSGKQIEQAKQADDSGIVDESSDNPNEAVIGMINEFLKRIDDETLAYIYEILVYVERDKSIAKELLTHLTQQEKAE
jgi:hypothetical protein